MCGFMSEMLPLVGQQLLQTYSMTDQSWILEQQRTPLVLLLLSFATWGSRNVGSSGCTPTTRWLTLLVMHRLRFCTAISAPPLARWALIPLLGDWSIGEWSTPLMTTSNRSCARCCAFPITL